MSDAVQESQIAQWRGYVEKHQAISAADADEMEDHLRDTMSDLADAGLASDEAFLVAVKRMGSVDGISREFAREHSERLWKQLVLVPTDTDGTRDKSTRELWIVIALALCCGIALKCAMLADFDDNTFMRNVSLFMLPFLTGYFAWKRRLSLKTVALLIVPFAFAGLLLNLYPFHENGVTEAIAAIHAPIALWFVVGFAYVGGEWQSGRRRMDFVRFTGEWVVYLTLLGLGVGVLAALTNGAFRALDMNVEQFFQDWLLPFAPGAVVVAAWLVEAKQSVIENIAPVLTRVFTPLTILMLFVLLVAFVVSGDFGDADRELLIMVDAILAVVFGLQLYAISARDPLRAPDTFDRMQLVLLALALVLDVLMLAAMLTRIAEFGFTANKTAALGMNLVLLVALAWSARLSFRFVRGGGGFAALESWQTRYLPVFGAWAAAVTVAIPLLFDFA